MAELTTADVLSAIKETGARTESVVAATGARTENVLAELAGEIRSMAQTIGKGFAQMQQGMPRNGRVSLGNVLTIVGSLAILGGFLIKGLQSDMATHETSVGHPKLSTRVEGLEKILEGEGGRNDKIEDRLKLIERGDIDWRGKHDREVTLINTSNAAGIESTHQNLCIVWSKVFPASRCPDVIPQPRIIP